MFKESFEYVVIGAGIAGCSTAYFLSKYSNSVLLIDRNCDVAQGASGAAGAFLSPLLGKPNKFKDLVTSSLKFSVDFYKKNSPNEINNCGVVRIPKNKEDREKFESYIPYMDFPFKKDEEGYFFDIGSQVNSYNICNFLAYKVQKRFNYEIDKIEKKDDFWLLNSSIKAKKLILATGADISLISEDYFNIRAVWGQKIDILTTTNLRKNYHKECSLSFSKKVNNKYLISIGATHHRFNCDLKICNHCIKTANINKMFAHSYKKETVDVDTNRLLKLASDIKELNDIELVDIKIGPRASSVDYFPMVGKLIDSKTTLEKYPHLINGSFVKDEMLISFDNLYVLNGVGGRGYVLSPYLANMLVESIVKNKEITPDIITHRLFKRWVKKKKLKSN